MDIKNVNPFVVIGIATLVLSMLVIPIAASVRKRRRKEAGKRRAKSLIQKIRLATSPKATDADRGRIPGLIRAVTDLSTEHGFPLYDVGASKERFEKWLYVARHRPEDRHPLLRRLFNSGMPNSPENVLNPDEPGTPGLLINGMLCLPCAPSASPDSGSWKIGPVADVTIPPAPEVAGSPSDAIAAMIDETLRGPDAVRRPAISMPLPEAQPKPSTVDVILETVESDGNLIEIIIEVEVPPGFRERTPVAKQEPNPNGKDRSVDDFVEYAFERMVQNDS